MFNCPEYERPSGLDEDPMMSEDAIVEKAANDAIQEVKEGMKGHVAKTELEKAEQAWAARRTVTHLAKDKARQMGMGVKGEANAGTRAAEIMMDEAITEWTSGP